MKHLSLASKMTITVAFLFFSWWLINEYQTYRFAIQLETKEFISDHYLSNQLGVDTVNDFVITAQEDLYAMDKVLRHFPEASRQLNPKQDIESYFLNSENKFVLQPEHEKQIRFSESLAKLLKYEYQGLIIQQNQAQVLSKQPLTDEALSFISKYINNQKLPALSWTTFIEPNNRYALVWKREKQVSLGFLIKLDPLLNKLHNEKKEQYQLLTTSNNQFLSQIPSSLSAENRAELKQLVSSKFKNQNIVEGQRLILVKSPVYNMDWSLITLVTKQSIKQHSLMLLLKKLPESLLQMILICALMLIAFNRLMRQPIKQIVEIISDPLKPNLSKKLPENRNDELGQIAIAYNKLLNQLQKSHSELEQQVANRTKYLLEASQAAQAANERKTEHLTSISHEIRTPLNGILGALELIQTTSITQKQKGLIDTASDCCHSLLSLVNNLLDFSRIEAGEIVLKSMSYQPLAVIDEAMSSIESIAINKGIKLSTLIDYGVPEEMQLDPLRVRQILVNLLGNAVKFTDRGEIKVILTCANQMLEYQIYDSGSGMTEKETITVFQPYVQGQHQKFGSGLGLPISKKLASMMDGKLSVISTKGKGSCFTLSVPIIDAGETISLPNSDVFAPSYLHHQLQIWGAQPKSSDNKTLLNESELMYMPYKLLRRAQETIDNIPHFPQSIMPVLLPWKLKVLVVDDVAINRDIISKMLNELGQLVYTAPSAYTALELGQKNIFDLVLMDIRMPEVNGYQATKIWRNSEDMLDNRCPIIALTANAEPQEQAAFEKAGMDYYVTKPVTLRELNHALEVAVDIQLERDISLTINNDNDTPLLDIMETDLTKKLYSQLLEMLLSLKGAVEVYNWEAAKNILHTIKGTCGLAGLTSIADTASELERLLEETNFLKLGNLAELNEQIKAMEFDSI
ncbi:hypothetical protein SOPP22_19565 [Shewanella sp. OPT22]|nr:hypothetical protein SOPP22_19565 [Shewanella sp. OPT22]